MENNLREINFIHLTSVAVYSCWASKYSSLFMILCAPGFYRWCIGETKIVCLVTLTFGLSLIFSWFIFYPVSSTTCAGQACVCICLSFRGWLLAWQITTSFMILLVGSRFSPGRYYYETFSCSFLRVISLLDCDLTLMCYWISRYSHQCMGTALTESPLLKVS